MNWLERKRTKQVRQYGWKDAKEIAPLAKNGSLAVCYDIINCFHKSWKLNGTERDQLLNPLGEKSPYRDDWKVWKYENPAFIDKDSDGDVN